MPLVTSSISGGKDGNGRKVRFMCSHAGKIIPRPFDRKLRYVGGETRMISMPRNINYAAFARKMVQICGPDIAVKYQLPGEDLDALVSVSCDEDLENMMDECEKLDFSDNAFKLRVFVTSLFFEQYHRDITNTSDPAADERRYINAVNALLDDAPFWKHDNSVPKGSVKSIAHGFQAFQMEENLSVPLFEGLDLRIPITNDLIPKSNITPVILSTHQADQSTCILGDQSFSAIISHSPTSNAQECRIVLPTCTTNAPENSQQQLKNFHHVRYPKNEIQTGTLLSDAVITNGQDLVTSKENFMMQSRSMDVNYDFDSGEPHERVGDWWHEDFSSSPGASLQKQLEEAGDVYCRSPPNGILQESQLDGWYTQQHVLHDKQSIEKNSYYLKAPLYDPWTSLVGNGDLASPISDALPVLFSCSHDTQSFMERTSSLIPHIDGEIGDMADDAPNANLLNLQSAKYSYGSKDPQWDVGSLPESNTVFSNISNPVFQTCFATSPSSKASDGCTVTKEATGRTPDSKENLLDENDSTFGRDEVSYFDRRNSFCESSVREMDLTNASYACDGSSKVSGGCFLDTQHNLALPSVSSGQHHRWLSDRPLFDESVHAGIYEKDVLTRSSICDLCVDQPSSAVDDTSIIDMISDLLQSSQVKDCLPATASLSDIELNMLNADNNKEFILEERCRALGSNRHMHASILDERQEVQSVETILSRLGHPNTTLAQLDAYDEEMEFPDRGDLASLHSGYENTIQDGSLMMSRKLAFEDTKPDEEIADDDFNSDSYVDTAAIAEAEAQAHGLQIIKNADLEELRELGSGTFGTVYHGKWRGTDVAIKRIKSSCFMGKPSERERLISDFLREAHILSQLHHPNVVAFYGIVPDGPSGTLATVTEYMVNGSLKQVLVKKDRTLDRRKRLLIAMDAAFGMEYLHGKNVVHFDLKCENLLVNLKDIQRPICKVADLGLSKVKKQTMVSGGVRGTLPWMAPELLSGNNSLVSEKIDVFSFGIVMWELLTGEEPYANMHYGAIIGGIVNNTLRPPVPRWCDAAWKSLMENCWAADPCARPTFSQVAASLRAMEASIGAKGCPVSPQS